MITLGGEDPQIGQGVVLMKMIAVLGLVLIATSCAATQVVETFESYTHGTVLTDQIPGLLISAPPSGTPMVREASEPTIPGEPMGLAHIPYEDFPDYLLIDFNPSVTIVTCPQFCDHTQS